MRARPPRSTSKVKTRTCPRSCTQHRTKSGRLAERRTFDGARCSNCGFTVNSDAASGREVLFESAADIMSRQIESGSLK